jgi:hypothetical protein
VTAPTASHHGYALAQPFQQKAFGLLAGEDDDNEDSVMALVTTQVAALNYQSQLINCSQHQPTPTTTIATDCGPRLGIPIFCSDFWDPHRKRNSDSVFNPKDSGRKIFLKFRY